MSRDIFDATPQLRRLLYRSGFALGPLVPLWTARSIAYLLAHVAWWFDARGRRICARNFAPVLRAAARHHRRRGPDAAALRRCVRRSYVACCFSIAEALHIHQLPRHVVREPDLRITDPWGVLGSGPLRGPLILATLHANFEICPAILHQRGHLEEIAAISLSHDDPLIDELFARFRSGAGVRTLLLEGSPLASLRALHDGAILGIVGDRDYGAHGVPVQLFDQPTTIPAGPAALAVQTGAAIVPMFCARRSHTRFHLFVGRPLHVDPARPKAAQVRELTRRLAAWYQRCVIAAPNQWIAFHALWDGVDPRAGTSSRRLTLRLRVNGTPQPASG